MGNPLHTSYNKETSKLFPNSLISSAKIKEIIFDPTQSFSAGVKTVHTYQLAHVPAYRQFSMHIKGSEPLSSSFTDLAYLPVELFRSQNICSDQFKPILRFESSGTTGTVNSIHPVVDGSLYEESIRRSFDLHVGDHRNVVFFALLPSYIERSNSSLIYMIRHLMQLSGHKGGGFYKFDHDRLINDLKAYDGPAKKVLIGVSFALWEMAEKYSNLDLSDTIVIETGGMKGRRKEITREELHDILCQAFNINAIQSEYGMTELLSQAYSKGQGRFKCPPWMKVLVRDPYDPLNVSETGKGALNIIDLANHYSCSFLATNDIGQVYADGTFEVKGRMDGAALRGCNLMF